MRNIILLLAINFMICSKVNAQETLYDNWQTVNSYSAATSSGIQDYSKAVRVGDKIVMVVDTFSYGFYNASGLYIYDIHTRTINPYPFTLDIGDRGLTAAGSYNNGVASYGIFGCTSSTDIGATYPVIYTYNGQSNTIIADSIAIGSKGQHEGGIQHITMFSPATNNDTVCVFSMFDMALTVFKKQINQTGFVSAYTSVPLNYISASIVYNNKLYLAGSYNDEAALLESSDGSTFTPVAGFVPGNHPMYSNVNNLDTLNGDLYYTVSEYSAGYNIYKYSGTTHTIIHQYTGSQEIREFKIHKNKLWYSTVDYSMSPTASIHYIFNGNSILSADQIGYQDVDGDKLSLIATQDSLYFLGNKGTFQASRVSNTPSTASRQLLDRYLNVWKLNSPIASFNYNNNIFCINSSQTFTSNSQYTDSLHWLKDGAYYISSPGGSAWMNMDFSTTGSHTVGLVAFGGTLTDTFNLAVTLYDVNATIASTRTLTCYNSAVSGSAVFTQTTTGMMGAVNYQWLQGFPTTSVSTASSYTYTPSSFGTTYPFWLVATDIHGCVAISNTISISTNPKYDIDGTLYSGSSPTITSVTGDVILYRYEPTLGKFDSLTYLTTTNWGYFDFTGVDDGDYILKAVPSASSLQISYYGTDALMWKDATPFTHTCASPNTNTINVIPLQSIGTGSCELRGKIYEDVGFVPKSPNDDFRPLAPGTPIGGIVVKGGKNPGGQMFSQTVSADPNSPNGGEYVFSNLPYGDYFILVDIPGLDTNGTYHVTLSAGTPSITNLNFYVDSIFINPVGSITAVHTQDENLFENKILLFPNPAREIAFIEYELVEAANVKIELYDMVGKKSQSIIEDTKQSKNKYKYPINIADISPGVYFIKVRINNHENVIKFVITN